MQPLKERGLHSVVIVIKISVWGHVAITFSSAEDDRITRLDILSGRIRYQGQSVLTACLWLTHHPSTSDWGNIVS